MATYNIEGMLHSNHEILEAKLNGKVIYKQSEKYVEYTPSGADEYIHAYESWLFPVINRKSGNDHDYEAIVYSGSRMYLYDRGSDYSLPFLANEITKIRIYYPDDITGIDFSNANWVSRNGITYIYTDDTITVRLPVR